jgi:hypothetical protein
MAKRPGSSRKLDFSFQRVLVDLSVFHAHQEVLVGMGRQVVIQVTIFIQGLTDVPPSSGVDKPSKMTGTQCGFCVYLSPILPWR